MAAGFDDGLTDTRQEHIQMQAISGAELLACRCYAAIVAVSYKHTSLHWTHKDGAILTVIDADCVDVIKKEYIGIFAVAHDKLLTSNAIWQASNSLILYVFNNEIFRIDPRSHIPRIRRFVRLFVVAGIKRVPSEQFTVEASHADVPRDNCPPSLLSCFAAWGLSANPVYLQSSSVELSRVAAHLSDCC